VLRGGDEDAGDLRRLPGGRDDVVAGVPDHRIVQGAEASEIVGEVARSDEQDVIRLPKP
jgi:hypothetical protein